MRLYTGKGDDGTTGLYFGGRLPKDSAAPEAYGTVDEAQSFLGLARSQCEPGDEVDAILLAVERDLYVLMAELATLPENRHKLDAGRTLVTPAMVRALEERTDDIGARFPMPEEFVLPGESRLSALLEVARTVVRRAERRALAVAAAESSVIPYLNRLSSLLWAMARWQEGRAVPARGGPGAGPDPDPPSLPEV
ncbi:MAG TPA: cob(I)yrinic acid a,c-diamide adenosyltransferase [Acidimicrobiales bacterium]|nr:cob(I)yrinic acid a,c-diamide adenosyltransferase [Acidimicrobiales bacterium]